MITYPAENPPVFCSVCGLRLLGRMSSDGARVYDSMSGNPTSAREKKNLVCPSSRVDHDSFIMAMDEGQPYCWVRSVF